MLLPRFALVIVLSAAACAGPTPVITGVPSASETATTATPAAVPTSVAPVVPAYAKNPRQAIAAALATAASSNRRVLVDFGADWCPDCRALDELYRDAAVSPLLTSRFLLVRVDVGHFDKHMDVSHKYQDAAAVGIPAVAVLNADGAVLVTTSDGSFANARTFTAGDVTAFLRRWS